jgi:hypothetical protein
METLAAKVPEKMADEIDQYADRHDLNRSQAIRALIEAGQEAEQSPDGVSLTTVIGAIGLFLFVGAYATIDVSQTAGNTGGLLVLLALLLQYQTVTDHLRHVYKNIQPDDAE